MEPKPIVYRAERHEDGVTLTVNNIEIPLGDSLQHVNHSPTGFEFGYGGSGPSQLSFAILLNYLADPDDAKRMYQKFKWDFVAEDRTSPLIITGTQITNWLYKNGEF